MVEPDAGPLFPLSIEVRPSSIQGMGVFAQRLIPKKTRIIEYVGERISHAEADARYNEDAMEHPYTYLFTVDRKTVIDATVQGNESRYINHSCEPNCEAVLEEKRIYIEALRDIQPGEELTYDYHLEYQGRYDPAWKERYACHCGAPSCRGTLLLPRPPRKKRIRKGAKDTENQG